MPHVIFGTCTGPPDFKQAAITAILQFDVSDISAVVLELRRRPLTSDNEFIQITVMQNNEIYSATGDSSERVCTEIVISSQYVSYRNDDKNLYEEMEHTTIPEWTTKTLIDMMKKVGMIGDGL